MSVGAVRALAGGVLIVALVIGVLLSALATHAPPDSNSARSTEPAGRLAAALLLEELGREGKRFDAAPIGLPRGRALVWMPGAPKLPDHLVTGPDDAMGPALDDPRHALFYRRFVEEGGTLVLPADDETREFLGTVFELDAPLGRSFADVSNEVGLRGEEPARVLFEERLSRDGEALRAPLAARGPEALATDAEGFVVALRIEQGAGAVVLLATDRFLTNELIALGEHALFFVRLVELLRPPGGPVHFDEFALGGWATPTKVELAFTPGARLLSLQLLLLALLWCWMHGWAREFPRDPPALDQRSPLARARAQAGLQLRAGHPAWLAERLRLGVLRRLVRALRLPEREVEEPAGRRAALDALADRLPANSASSVDELFQTRAVKNAADLERLGADLLALERRLGGDSPDGRGSTLPEANVARQDAAATSTQS